MSDCMIFPDDWRDFLRDYSFKDSAEVYTNGAELIPVFRVEQLIEHLLKELEPRVLTLEEVTAEDECWFEHKSGVYGYVSCYICTGNRSVEVWRTSKQGPDYLSWERYLKGWRCWSSRPTDEQREAVPWED